MFTKKSLLGAGAVTLLIASFTAVTVLAQTHGEAKAAAKEVTLKGKIVDLHCYMTAEAAPADATKCAACIAAGVPAALETAEGLVLLGQGEKGAAKACAAHAGKEVSVKGKLFEKAGVKYLDIETVEAEAAAAGAHTGANPT